MLASLLQADEAATRRGTAGVDESPGAWVDGDFQTTFADYEGPFVELDEALDAFSSELERRLAGRSG